MQDEKKICYFFSFLYLFQTTSKKYKVAAAVPNKYKLYNNDKLSKKKLLSRAAKGSLEIRREKILSLISEAKYIVQYLMIVV